MKKSSSLMNRIIIGKSIGFLVGGLGFLMIPMFWPEVSLMFRFAIWAWYMTLGAIVALFGVMDKHPCFNFKMSWWLRGTVMGAWMNFVLVLFIHDKILALFQIQTSFGWLNAIDCPFWLVAEGALIGLLIDWAATKYGGEGKKIV